MLINKIDNQTFESKKFRLITDSQLYCRVGSTMTNFKTSGKYVREYSNPRAEELYNKAKATRDIKEKAFLYEQMGHYELKSLNLHEIIREKFNKFIMDFLF